MTIFKVSITRSRYHFRYYIAKYTNDMPRKLQRSEIQRAVKLWSEVAPVDFKIVSLVV